MRMKPSWEDIRVDDKLPISTYFESPIYNVVNLRSANNLSCKEFDRLQNNIDTDLHKIIETVLGDFDAELDHKLRPGT